MKKLTLITSLFVCISNYLFAQWITNGANTVTSTSNAIGIGTATPVSNLQVVEPTTSKPGGVLAPTKSVFKLSRSGTSGYSYNESAEFRIGHGGPSFWGSQLDLFINSGNNQNDIPDQHAMTWTYNGNVGVGTTGPIARLHLIGSGVSIDGGNSISINNNDLAIQANTGGRSTTLGAQLEFIIPANTDGTNAWGQARIITVAGNTSNSNATGKMILGTRRSFDKLGTGAQWYYGNDLIIDGTGNIGVGTLTPDQKLSVNGTVHAKSVVIDLNGWSDYVFKKDYRLPALKEVKSYIRENKHLPGVPSEAEMIKTGLDVSEANKLLLKKMEEMTLYMIKATEEITALKKEVKQLKNKLNKR
ncbi:hypothetical protein [Mucilaginibacter sp. NFR10]|uniref:hypothetical protein n=1 Tax=Mucilaginibacter sp. NFR10 TaxID=1566292 RepID=UPI00087131D3|nr:hypothetical protein [Mucilaginibacter sp. NFR10]SCW65875.1 hypothetical protein SAMN03159284_02890 [Mucilaginibacter sp. NFR10]